MAVGEANAAWGSYEKKLKIHGLQEKIKKHTKQETYAHLCCKGVAAVKMAQEKSAENLGEMVAEMAAEMAAEMVKRQQQGQHSNGCSHS